VEVEGVGRVVPRLVGAPEAEKVGRDQAASGRQKVWD
jgi:hypothetical protein